MEVVKYDRSRFDDYIERIQQEKTYVKNAVSAVKSAKAYAEPEDLMSYKRIIDKGNALVKSLQKEIDILTQGNDDMAVTSYGVNQILDSMDNDTVIF